MDRVEYDGPGELWISDISAVREQDTSRFDRVVTTCQDSVADNVGCSYEHYNMADGEVDMYGGKCNYAVVEQAADAVYDALVDGETVLCHCHMGQSRSVSVSIAVLGRLLDLERYEARDLVEEYRPQAHPDMDLFDYAGRYIEEHR